MKIRKSLLLAAATGLAASSVANAVVLADANFDTYSYVFMGTNSDTNPELKVSQENPSGHFMFSVVTFDVSSLSTSGDKYLSLQATGYSDGSLGATMDPVGSGSINVGVLTADYSDYLVAADKYAWFSANVATLSATTMSFTNSEVSSLDVTASVNNWITGASSNYGFVFWKEDAGQINLASSQASSGYTPALTSSAIPEPETFGALAGILALGMAIARRRVSPSRDR